MNFASRSTTFFAFGPGSSVTNRGNFALTSAVVIIFFLLGNGALPVFGAASALSSAVFVEGRNRLAGSMRVPRKLDRPIPEKAPARRKVVSLRRRGSDAVRRANSRSGIAVRNGFSFAFPADAAVLRIFKHYTTFRKLFADAIRRCKVPLLPRRLPFRHQRRDLGIVAWRILPPVTKRSQLLGILVFQHRKDAIETVQKLLDCAHVALLKRALIDRN